MLRAYFKQGAVGCAAVATSGGVAGGPEAGAGALMSGKVATAMPVPVPPSRLPLLVLPSSGATSWLPSGTPPTSPSSWAAWSIEDMSLPSSAASTPATSPVAGFTEPPRAANAAERRKSLDEARYLRSFDSWT